MPLKRSILLLAFCLLFNTPAVFAEDAAVRHFSSVNKTKLSNKSVSKEDKSFQLNEQGVHLILKGERQEGLSKLEQARILDPKNTTALYNLAGVYLSVGKPAKAVEAMETAVALNSGDLDFRNRLAEAHFANGNIPKSIAQYENIISVNFKYQNALLRLGTLYGMVEKWDEAEKTLSRAIEVDESNIQAITNLSSLQLSRDKYQAALETIGKVPSTKRTSDLEMNAGLALEALEQNSEALTHYKRAKELGSTDPVLDSKIVELSK